MTTINVKCKSVAHQTNVYQSLVPKVFENMTGKGVFVLLLVLVVTNVAAIENNDIRVQQETISESKSKKEIESRNTEMKNNEKNILISPSKLNTLMNQEVYLYSVKHKRSPESLSDLKLRIQERRNEALCKYCIKSLIRMKSNICKRCIRTKPKLPLKTGDKPIVPKPKTQDTKTKSQSLKNKLSLLDIDNKVNKITKHKNIPMKQEHISMTTKELIELLKKRLEENKLNKKQQSGIIQMKNPQLFNDERKKINESHSESDSRVINIPLTNNHTKTNFMTALVTQAMKTDQTHNLPKGTTISELLKDNLLNKETAKDNYSNTLSSDIVSNSEIDITPTMSLKDLQLISTKLKTNNAFPAHDKDGTSSKNIRPKRLKTLQDHINENCDLSYPEYADIYESNSQEYCDEPEQDYHRLSIPINPNQYLKSTSKDDLKINLPDPTIATENTETTFGENFRDIFTELFKPNPTILNQINNNNNDNIDTNDNDFKDNLSKLHNKLHDISAEHINNNNYTEEKQSDVGENIQAILDQHGINWSDFHKDILKDNNSNTDPFYQDILDKISDKLYSVANSDLNELSTNSDMNNELLQPTNDPYLSTSNNYQSLKSTRSVDGKRSTSVLDNDNNDNHLNQILTSSHQKPAYNIPSEEPEFDNQKSLKNIPGLNSDKEIPFDKNILNKTELILDDQNSTQTTLEPNLGLNNKNLSDEIPENENNSKPNKETESNDEVSIPNIYKYIKNQHFLNRMTYMKHPRLKSTYDGNHMLMPVSEHPVYTKHKLSIFDESITTEKIIDLKSVTKPTTFEQTNFPTVSPVTNRISMKENTAHDSEMYNGKVFKMFHNKTKENTKIGSETNVDVIADNETIKKLSKIGSETNVDVIADNETIKNQNISNNVEKAITYNNNNKNKLADTINSTEINVVMVSNNNIDDKNINKQTTLSEPTKTETDLFLNNINMHPIINKDKYNGVMPLSKEPSENLGSAQQNIPIINNEEDDFENQPSKNNNILPNKHNNFDMLTVKNALAAGQIITSNDTSILSDHIRFAENKIDLPLVLKQNIDGTFQLIMDNSRICNCPHCNCTNCHNFEKNTLENSTPYSSMQQNQKAIFKRKTDEAKHPLNMFNIIGKAQDHSKTQINNILHSLKNPDSISKEAYYKNLINEKLFEFFDSLNIPIKNIKQLQTYIDNLPNKEKDELEKYILNQIINNNNNFSNKQKRNKDHHHIWEIIKHKDIYEPGSETRNNRIHFNIQSHPNDLEVNENVLKTFIQNEIINVLQQSNVCALCNNNNYIHKNPQNVLFDANEHESKMLHKRHFLNDDSSNGNTADINPQGLIKQKYKIVNDLLNWARDMFVNDTRHSD